MKKGEKKGSLDNPNSPPSIPTWTCKIVLEIKRLKLASLPSKHFQCKFFSTEDFVLLMEIWIIMCKSSSDREKETRKSTDHV